MKRFALIGENISYSRSAEIHNAFYKVTGIRAEYSLLDIPCAEFDNVVNDLWAYNGFNVTKPYKERILSYICAEGLRAVNTVAVRDGLMYGFNTDGSGFSYAMRGVELQNKRVLLLGAGGAAYAIAAELIRLGADLFIYNRTEERALSLAENAGGRIFDKSVVPQIIINATTVGQLSPEMSLPDFIETQDTEYIFDSIYTPTPLLEFAAAKGIKHQNGFKMLIAQAVYSEGIFNNMEITDEIIEAVTALAGNDKRSV